MERATANPRHPFSHFSTGTRKTLQVTIHRPAILQSPTITCGFYAGGPQVRTEPEVRGLQLLEAPVQRQPDVGLPGAQR